MSAEQTPSIHLYVPAMARIYRRLEGWTYPLVRIVTGLWLLPHGSQKLFAWFGGGGIGGTAAYFAKLGLEPALPLAYLVGATEFFGGLLIAIGLWTRPAAAAACILLLFATFTVHMDNGFFIVEGGYEYALMWALLALCVFFRGGGPESIDQRIGKEF